MAEEKQKQQPVQTETQDDFAVRIAESVAKAVAQATIQVQEKLGPIEKKTPSLTSPYNPEGLKDRPRLQRRYVVLGAEVKEKFLTNKEIVALNTISTPGDYMNNRWHVRVRRDDSNKETVFIEVPTKSIDDRMALPHSLLSLIDILKREDEKQKAVVAR